MKRYFSRRGFTLTETLIGLVVFMILAGTVSAVILTGFNIYSRNALKNSAQSIGDTAYDLISGRLSYCTKLTVSDRTEDVESLEVAKNRLLCIHIPAEGDRIGMGVGSLSPRDVITPAELSGLTLEISAEPDSGTLMQLTVTVLSAEDERQLYSRSGTIRLFNAAADELDTYCDVQSSSNSYSDIYFVFNETA